MSSPYIFAAQISDVHRTQSIKGTLHQSTKYMIGSQNQYEFVPEPDFVDPLAGVLDESYSQLIPLSEVAVQARQST
jgi:hypothetical protein